MRCATSRTAWEWSRHSSATPWPLLSTSGGNESTWAAMLLWLGHSQYQRWLAAHHCGFQSVTCSSIISDCRAERHCCAPIKQLQSHFNKISEVSPCAEEGSRKQRPKGSIYAVPYWWIGRGCCFWNRTLKKLFQWWWRPGLLLASSTLMIIVSITNHQAATGIAWCFPTAAVFLLRMRTMKYKLLKPLLIQGYYAGIETSKCLAWRKMLFVSQALVTHVTRTTGLVSFCHEEPNSKKGNDMPLGSETPLQDFHLQKQVLNEPRLNPTSITISVAVFNDLNWLEQLARNLAPLRGAEVSPGSTCSWHT